MLFRSDAIHLMASSDSIGKGIREDLDMEISKIGISITDFSMQSVNYPENIQKMVEKAASQSMVGDMGRYGGKIHYFCESIRSICLTSREYLSMFSP